MTENFGPGHFESPGTHYVKKGAPGCPGKGLGELPWVILPLFLAMGNRRPPRIHPDIYPPKTSVIFALKAEGISSGLPAGGKFVSKSRRFQVKVLSWGPGLTWLFEGLAAVVLS